MLTIILIILGALVGVLLFAAAKPAMFRIQRSADIQASPEKIFAQINDFHKWRTWSPWENIDPELKRTYSGSPSGTGAVYEWQGNNKVGAGRMQIMEAVPPSRIMIKLDFFKPFEAHNTAEFILNSGRDSTNVTWAMYGPQPYMAKLMSLFMNMDRMVGTQFETGLTNLKHLSES